MNPVLTATILVGVIGLVAALLLVIASHYMAVEVNEKEAALRACLPGANCGSCGYTGCDNYAAAMAADESVPGNLCRPGGPAAIEKIAAVLGVTAQQIDPLVAYVHCRGDCDARQDLSDYQGLKTCAAARLLFGGKSACDHGCLGCGDCAGACPNDAICMEKGIAHIDPRRCMGCGICTRTCPNKLISLIPTKDQAIVSCSSTDKGSKVRSSCRNGCIGCTLCVKHCDAGAVSVENNLARVDPEKCHSCGKCIEKCPTGAIGLLQLDKSKAVGLF